VSFRFSAVFRRCLPDFLAVWPGVELPFGEKAKVKKGKIVNYLTFFLFEGHLFTGFDLLGARRHARETPVVGFSDARF
jgi:hypothetical protein